MKRFKKPHKRDSARTYAITTGHAAPGGHEPAYEVLPPKLAKRRLASLPPLPSPLPVDHRYPTSTEDLLIARARLGCRRAGDMLLLAYDKSLRQTAKQWYFGIRGHDLEIDDLLQVARMGLMHALHKYERSKGSFSTYVQQWTMQHCLRAIQNDGYSVRLPVHCHQELSSHDKNHGDKPLPERLVKIAVAKRPSRLDEPIPVADWEVGATRGEMLVAVGKSPEEQFATDQHHEIVRDAVARLSLDATAIDMSIIRERLLSDEPMNLADIARLHNRSRERARQRQGVVMSRLRAVIKSRYELADVS